MHNDDIKIKPNAISKVLNNFQEKHGKLMNVFIYLILLGLLWGYFGWATYYQIAHSGMSSSSN